jgi:hypothetical protein
LPSHPAPLNSLIKIKGFAPKLRPSFSRRGNTYEEETVKDYNIRFEVEVPDASSENVAKWLDDALASGASLTSDPGGGDVFIHLSLDERKVSELANRLGIKNNVAIRRLIATRANLPAPDLSAKRESATELLPGKVLPKKLEYKEGDLLPAVRALNSGLAFAYRRVYRLPDLLATTPEEDRQLASAMAEVLNRRSPEWVLANADLLKLTFSFARWSLAQTGELDRKIAEVKEKAKKEGAGPSNPVIPGVPPSAVEDLNEAFAHGIGPEE